MTTTADDLAQRIREASAARSPLRIRGGGTKDWYGRQPAGTLLDTTGYTGIVDYDPSELVITVKCGTRLADVQAALAAERQMLAFEPPSFGDGATVGGMVAAGLSGPRRAYTGALRDYMLGSTLIDGQGELLRFGGRVMKNVAGYDVARLMAGSLGSLGLLLDLSIKVLPMPASDVTLAFDLSQEQALHQLTSWASRPLPVSASSWEQHDDCGRLLVRMSGSVAATTAALAQLGGERLDDAGAAQHWANLREQQHRFFAGAATLWRIALPTTAAPLDLHGAQLIEWGGAQRWLADPQLDSHGLRSRVSAAGGHATLFRGGDRHGNVFQPLPAALLTIHRRLKAAFDPAGIFNPGRLIEEL